MFNTYLQLLRPRQYVKNLFVFVPLFFANQITDPALFSSTLLAFIAFSLAASGIYIFNDYRDIESDRLHPTKMRRPLAAGKIAIRHAMMLMLILLAAACVLMALVGLQALMFLLIYLVLNLAYSVRLKHITIIDVSIIASGFVLRLFVGASTGEIMLSMWIVMMTFLLALFLALAKRRDDIIIYHETGQRTRPVVDGYNLPFLDSAIMMMASVTLVAYIMFTTSADITRKFATDYLYITALFVIMAILRYLQVIFVDKNSGNPTQLILTDTFMQLCIACWILAYAWIIYF